jgi:hypothetical protein
VFELPHLEPTFKLGDLITLFSVIVALAGFSYTWNKDRKLRTKEYADRVRSAAATTLAKIDRCESLFISFPNILQPIITETDELIVRTKNRVETRDMFWRQVTNARLTIHLQFREEEIELAYAPLLPFREDIYDIFRGSIDSAKQVEDKFFWTLLNACQAAILEMTEGPIMSAALGNVLRQILGKYQDVYSRDLTNCFAPVRRFLNQVVRSSDKELVIKN